MRSRLSIFSSDTLRAGLQPTKGVWLALALCVGFRLLLGWVGPGFTRVAGYWLIDTDMGWAQVQMDREPVDDVPRCLVLGSSRIGLGIHEATLADQLGFQVIKTAVNAGTPWTFLHMFEADPDLLDGVEAMVIDIEYFQFNDNSPVREGLRYVRLADYDGWRERLWPIDRERRELMEVAKGVALHATNGRPYRPMDERWKHHEANPSRVDPGMLPDVAARRATTDFEFSEFMVDTWTELADLCRRRGIELFVVHPPVKTEFVTRLAAVDDWARNHAKFMDAVAELDARPGTSVLFTEQLVDVGLEDEGALFIDYGHMTGIGARRYTAWLGEEIQTRLAADRGAGADMSGKN